ncbi:MAG: hypothetical protein V3S69_07805 [Dehalococcoidales bacterium]
MLGLRDDEIAEIHKVDSHIGLGNIPDAANDDVNVYKALSMDPDVSEDPSVAANNEDLEKFMLHSYAVQQEIGAAGQSTLRNSDEQVHTYDPPILVGTDIGQVVIGDAAVTCEFWTRVFFTRRKATAQELNQILLKRR